MQGTTVPMNVETKEVTAYMNEAETRVRNGTVFPCPPTVSDLCDEVYNDIRRYLSRPKAVIRSSLDDNWGLTVPFVLDSAFFEQFLAGRLGGALGFRATMCVRLQVATSPYIGGMLRLVFQPYYDADNPNNSTCRLQNRATAQPTAYQLPGVMLDLATETVCEFKIPYAYHQDFLYNPVTASTRTQYTYGTVSVTPHLRPVLPTGGGVASYPWTLYFWMEDVEILGSTGTSMQTDTSADLSYGLLAQSGMPKEEEFVVSEALYAGSHALDIVSRAPGAQYLRPLSWASRVAAKTAEAMGFSKPTNLVPQRPVSVQTITNQFHADGDNSVVTLSTLSDAKIAYDTKCFGVDHDEMELDRFLSHSGLLHIGSVSAFEAARNTRLFSLPICPAAMYYNTGVTLGQAVRPIDKFARRTTTVGQIYTTPAFIMSTCSTLWRGNFRIKVRFGKTKFHTGRVALCYQPHSIRPQLMGDVGVTTVTNVPDFSKSAETDNLTVIWDLREGNEADIVIPFTSSQPYLPVESWAGTFSLVVLDNLVFPESVAQFYRYSVSVSCEPGFRFAGYKEPFVYVSPTDLVTYTAQSQSGLQSAECQAIGEEILSIKQLLLKSDSASVQTGSTVHPWLGAGTSRVMPLGCNVVGNTLSYDVSGTLSGFARFCLHDLFIHSFAMMRGSTDFEGKCTNSASSGVAFTLFGADLAGKDLTRNAKPSDTINMGRVLALSSTASFGLNNLMEVTRVNAPMLTGTRALPTNPNTYSHAIPITAVNIHRFGSLQATPNYVFLRRAGDDFQLGYFIGTPPISLIAGPEILSTVVAGPTLYDNFATQHTGIFPA